MGDPELSEMLDDSVSKHAQLQQAKQGVVKVSPQKQSSVFHFSDKGVLLCTSTNKHAFDTEVEAKDAASFIEAERGTKLDVYRCPDCDKWHLTSHNH